MYLKKLMRKFEKKMKKFWHELSNEEAIKEMKNKTWNEIRMEYSQPEWCGMFCALDFGGCWSLIGGFRNEISRDFCKDCEFYKE